MATLTHWNPTSPAYTTREPFYRLFDTFFGNMGGGEDIASRTWTPPVDIQETENAYILQMELPGLGKEDLEITLENNVLRISGERKIERDVDRDNYHRIERVYGTFSRSFVLPSRVDPDGVDARVENGILTVAIPKAEEARPRKISVSAGNPSTSQAGSASSDQSGSGGSQAAGSRSNRP